MMRELFSSFKETMEFSIVQGEDIEIGDRLTVDQGTGKVRKAINDNESYFVYDPRKMYFDKINGMLEVDLCR